MAWLFMVALEGHIQTFNFLSSALIWLSVGVVTLSMMSSLNKSSLIWVSFVFILVVTFFSDNLLKFYIFFEMSLIPIFLLILYMGSQPERLSASLYLILYTSAASMPFLMIVLMFNTSFFSLNSWTLSALMGIFSVLPFLVKMPIFGLHFWLPKAHVEASTSGSMVLAGVLLKLGSYGVWRVSIMSVITFFKFLNFSWMMGAILSSSITYMQSDIKKVVAYSSITHMTFLMVGISLLASSVLMMVLILSLSHGWASSSMFSSAGTMSQASSSRLSFLIKSEDKVHWFTLMVGLILVSNASLPPFPSFFCELFLVISLSLSSFFVIGFVLLSLSVCYYNTFIFVQMSHSKELENKSSSLKLTEFSKQAVLNYFSFSSLLWFLLV